MKRILILTLATIGALCCDTASRSSSNREQVDAAERLTSRYAASRLSRWHVRGQAAGTDCRILFIETSIILEDSMVEALHYGTGPYDVYQGGVQQFSRDRAFRGVAYRDPSRRVWTFGDVTPAEAATFSPCRGE